MATDGETPAPVPVAGPRDIDACATPARRTDWPGGTPIWLLDVDGVINAVTRLPDLRVWPDYRTGFATARGRQWPITYSATVTRMIREVSESRALEVLWLTTWEDEANGDLADLLGLPPLPVAGRAVEVGAESRSGWWKLQVARSVQQQARERPIVWTDDDLVHDVDAREWIRSRGLGISPVPHLGLEQVHLRKIRDLVGAGPGR